MAEPTIQHEDLGVYEMLWDCSYCGTKKLLGKTHRHCPECGAAQDAEHRYFPADEEKVAVKDHVYTGADRVCGSCNTANSQRAKHCIQCGASLEGSREVVRHSSQVAAEGLHFAASSAKSAKFQTPSATTPPGALAASRFRGGFVLLGILLIAVVIVGLFWKRSIAIHVSAQTWEREIRIERLEEQTDSSWCDEVPAGAYAVRKHREERSQRDVPDGQTCQRRRIDNGDGTFKEERECTPKYRKEPVYDDRCNYLIERWTASRSLRTQGGMNDPPQWPPFHAHGGSGRGAEREGRRKESYTVHFFDPVKQKEYTCDYSFMDWRSFHIGEKIRAKVHVMIGGLDCKAILREHLK